MTDRDSRRKHVEEIFQPTDIQASTDRHMYKKKPAPKPPSDAKPLPKIGNYQPKSLLSAGNDHDIRPSYRKLDPDMPRVPLPEIPKTHDPEVGRLQNGPMIMGDKDTPLQIDDNGYDEPPSPKPRKRRAPNAPVDRQDSSEPYITLLPIENETKTNPLFERSVCNMEPGQSDIEPIVRDIVVEDSVGREYNHQSNGVVRPFNTYDTPSHSEGNNGDNTPFIPPPDYDDQEETMIFDEESDFVGELQSKNNRISLYQDYDGEDYGKYLRDDEVEFGDRWRSPPKGGHHNKSNRIHDKRFTHGKKNKKPSPDQNRNTIRNFAFTDSKIGWGDRTVKSTSAKGRYIKREKEKERRRVESSFQTGPNYEQFLHDRDCMNPESLHSSDSGLGDQEEMRDGRMYYHSQPKQFRKDGTLSAMWQKLTWRFRKSVAISSKYEPR